MFVLGELEAGKAAVTGAEKFKSGWAPVEITWFVVAFKWIKENKVPMQVFVYLSFAVWCVVCGAWHVVCGTWHVACNVWCVACGAWHVACGTWCVACVHVLYKYLFICLSRATSCL